MAMASQSDTRPRRTLARNLSKHDPSEFCFGPHACHLFLRCDPLDLPKLQKAPALRPRLENDGNERIDRLRGFRGVLAACLMVERSQQIQIEAQLIVDLVHFPFG